MSTESLNKTEKQGGSAAAKISYSAQELAEVYMTSRDDFFGIPMEEATNYWNLNYIYDFLYKVREPREIEDAIEWLVVCWKKSHHYRENYKLAFDNGINENYLLFRGNLMSIKEKLMERYRDEIEEETLKARMLSGYGQPTISIEKPQEVSTTNTSKPFTSRQVDSDNNGQDVEEGVPPVYHMADLPQDVRNCFTFDDDETYTLFVTNMRNDTWLLVKGNKGKYLDRLRFVSNKFGITGKNTTRAEYDKMLHYVIPDLGDIGNLESAMKKQSDTMISQNYGNYDSPVYQHRLKCRELIAVGLEIEECLTPVLEKINNKVWNREKNPR